MKIAPRPRDEDAGAVGLVDAPRASTMMATVQRRYGQPDVLEYTAVPKPVAGDDDVLVRVHAAAVHPGDYYLMTGVPTVVRLAFGLRRPRNGIRGMDVAGRVEAVGRNVQGLEPGDEVFGWSSTGTLAEYTCAPADNFAPKPANLTMEQAAAIPVSAFTALQALRDIARVQPGQTVLITGASGGVGTFAVQIAKAFGAKVTGVCSTRNVDLVRSVGADHVIDYTQVDFTRIGQRYDVILDNVEAQSLSAARRALTPTGALITNNGKGCTHSSEWVGIETRWMQAASPESPSLRHPPARRVIHVRRLLCPVYPVAADPRGTIAALRPRGGGDDACASPWTRLAETMDRRPSWPAPWKGRGASAFRCS